MKTLTSLMDAARSEGPLDVVWVARFRAGDGWLPLAARTIRVDGVEWPPLLLSVASLDLSTRKWMNLPFGGTERAVVEVARPDISHALYSDSIMSLLSGGPEGADMEIGLIFLPSDPSAVLTEQDPLWLFHGRIEEVDEAPLRWRIEARGWMESAGAAVPRALPPEALARFGMDTRAETIPAIVFGRVPLCPLEPWRLRIRGRLARAAEYSDTIMYVDSVDGWPPAGRVQIGDEVLTYNDLNALDRALGTEGSPLSRPEARAHRLGATVWLLPDAGPEWLVAGHPCLSVGDIRAGGRPLPEGLSWETAVLEAPTAEGEGLPPVVLATLRLERIPWTIDYGTHPVVRHLTPEETARSIAAATTATDGAGATDNDPATAARLTAGAAELHVAFRSNLGRVVTPDTRLADRALGRFHSLAVEVLLGADRLWNSASRVALTFRCGLFHATRFFTRPAEEECLARVAPLAVGEEALTGDTSVAPRLYSFDYSDMIDLLGGWKIFDPEASPPEAEIVFMPVDDPATIRVYDVRLLVGFCPASRCDTATDLTATVEGRMDESGALIESPVAILRDLLTAEDLGNEAESSLVAPDWAAAETEMAARGARMRRRVASSEPLNGLIASVAQEAVLCVLREAAGWRIRGVEAAPLEDAAERAIDDGAIVAADSAARERFSRAVNHVEILGLTPGAGGGRVRLAEAAAVSSIALPWGRREARALSEWWAADGTADAQAARLARAIVDRGARPGQFVEIETPLAQSDLERGDVVSLAASALSMNGRVGELEYTKRGNRATTLLLGLRLTPAWIEAWASSGGEARVLAASDGTALAFVVEGKRVALLGADGALRLGGTLSIDEYRYEFGFEPIFWDGAAKAIGFAAGLEATPRVVGRLDGDGNLRLAAAYDEGVSLGVMDSPGWFALQQGDLVFSADRKNVHARFRSGGDVLAVGKEVIENAF